jgi:hypothetical protein
VGRAARHGPRHGPGVRVPPVPTPTPRQLPPAADLVARDEYLAAVDALLTASATGPVVVALVGTPGVGKTALALRWAHRVADRVPDGRLYADLGGHGEGEPVPPRAVLGEFLRGEGGGRGRDRRARWVGGPYERARARHGVARAECASGRHGVAARSWRAAAEGYAALGVPDRAVPDRPVCAVTS